MLLFINWIKQSCKTKLRADQTGLVNAKTMGFVCAIVEALLVVVVIILFGLISAIIFEAYRRRDNHAYVNDPNFQFLFFSIS